MDATTSSTKIMPDHHWQPSQLDPHLLHLLQVALEALATEDDALAKAFAAGHKSFYEEVNQGITYWVFESQLVYTIFKAWIPKIQVRWEHAFYKTSGEPINTESDKGQDKSSTKKKADLEVVLQGCSVPLVFEAKWWNLSTKRQHHLLDADIAKLCRIKATERYLLTFWWSEHLKMAKDVGEVSAYCSQYNAKLGHRVDPLWLGSFRTDWTADRGKSRVQDGTFSMALLHVTPQSAAARTSSNPQ